MEGLPVQGQGKVLESDEFDRLLASAGRATILATRLRSDVAAEIERWTSFNPKGMHRPLIGLVLPIMFAAPLSAQARDLVSVDISVGPGTSWGGRQNYADRGGVAGELTIASRGRPGDETARIGAFTIGVQGLPYSNDRCALESGPDSKCRPEFPNAAHLGLLGGLEHRVSGGAVRILAGPAVYGVGGGSGVGGELQLDAAAGSSHLAVVLAARSGLVFRSTGETLRLGSLGIGLRVQ